MKFLFRALWFPPLEESWCFPLVPFCRCTNRASISFLIDGHQNWCFTRCRVFMKPKCLVIFESWHFQRTTVCWPSRTYSWPLPMLSHHIICTQSGGFETTHLSLMLLLACWVVICYLMFEFPLRPSDDWSCQLPRWDNWPDDFRLEAIILW